MSLSLPTAANTPVSLDRFLAVLSGRGWIKSAAICEVEPRLTPRSIRALAERAGGEIISCPAKGYRLTREATADEVRHALADLHSRARKLLDREVRTSQTWHAALHQSRDQADPDQQLL